MAISPQQLETQRSIQSKDCMTPTKPIADREQYRPGAYLLDRDERRTASHLT